MPNWKKVIVSGSDASLNSLAVTTNITATSFTGSLFGTASWAQNALTASFFGGSVTSASYASNGGVTQLLAGANITLSPTNGLGQVTIVSTGGGGSSFNTATGSYGSFYSTQIQTNVAGTARSMSLNVTDITNGVSVSGSTDPYNTYIKTENAGVYDIQFSAQVDKTDSGTDEIWIWLRKNGTNLTDTATSIQLTGNGDHYVAAWNFFVNSAANDYYQLMWYSPDANVRLHAEPAFGVVPGIPSLIVTVNRVDQFLSNTGSFSGTFTGSFTGSLLGTASTASFVTTAQTASYVLNAVSASFATSASYAVSSSRAISASYAPTITYTFNNGISDVGSNTIRLGGNLITNTDIGGNFSLSRTADRAGSSFIISNPNALGTGLTVSGTNIAIAASGSVIVTGSVSSTLFGFTGSLLGTASFATSASYALSSSNSFSSSYVLQAVSASFASTASSVNILNQNVIITGSLTVGSSSIGPNENTITLGARDSVNEGGQIGFSAPGGTFTSASFIDNWSNYIRILRGTNATSTGLVAQWNLHTLQMELPGYTNASSFVGTATANLAVDSSGKVITVSTTGGSVFPYTGNAVITGSLTTTGVIYAQPNGGMYFQGGDDAALYDINVVNTIGVYGVQDSTIGSIKLGSGGGTISGKSGFIGINTITPSCALDINANTLTGARIYSGSLAVGNIVPSATIGRIDASNDIVAYSTSDINFKENITPINNALEKINKIGGYEFDWKQNEDLIKFHGFSGHDIGVIAQEIEKVLPEVVTTRDNGYKAVKYEKIIPLLIEAIKAQQSQINDLKEIIKNK
jgi:hypothetical protein